MTQHNRDRYSLIFLALFAAGCASTGGAGPTATAPVVVPPETVVVEVPAATVAKVEPGRFDTGKMWTFENPPLDYFEEAYRFRPTEEWLTNARMAALRLPNCTASFVSPQGLVLSNHHCARESATAVSREGEDLLEEGFYAASLHEERRVPDLYVDQLVELRDITQLVEASVDPTAPEDEQVRTRNERTTAIADSAELALSLDCSVTTLYQGGKHSLYCFRRYDDVRLVFVPELAIGYFGGDPDNFTYPRYVLDVSFFRVYDDNGNPLTPAAHFGWSAGGAREGQPVFVIGNPGSTSRLNTVAQLEYERDVRYPFLVRLVETRAQTLWDYMEEHPNKRSEVINDYFSIANARKAYRGELGGLRNPNIMGRKVAFERQFKEAVQSDPDLRQRYGTLWDEITDLRQQIAEIAPRLNALNQGGILRSRTLEAAATMLQYTAASASGTAPTDVLQQIREELDGTVIDPELDALLLQAQLEDAVYLLGENDTFVRQTLAGRSPAEAARSIVAGATAVTDSTARATLLATPAAIIGSSDPALALMRDILPQLIDVGGQYQQLIGAEEVRAAKLARALFDVMGTSIAPDATFTLRIADGVVKGYKYNGTEAPAFTTFHGMYDRHYSHADREDWELPERWLTAAATFDRSTPLNMVTTNDITGGNSGSPMINTEREVVGLIFDGNIESLPGEFVYTTETSRAISVHSAGILEALRHVYGADRIVSELLGDGGR